MKLFSQRSFPLLACVPAASPLLFLALASIASAQTPLHLRGQVHDPSGHAVSSANIVANGPAGEVTAVSDADGRFQLDYPNSTAQISVRATTHSMESDPISVTPASATGEIDLMLHPSAVAQQITVTATRSSMDLPATANTSYALTAEQLNAYPATELDDKLRQQAGFELYRRSSSRVQNPTSQGISLRGLGSTAVSRTLVLEDNAPMNDPFGGWIHWDEIPAEAIDAVTIATGGGSDLYGSSALGGVIDVVPAHPTSGRFDVNALGGGQATSSVGVRADAATSQWGQLLAADSYRTAGYIPTAPTVAGPVDVAANVHDQAVRSETDRVFGSGSSISNRAFLVGNMLNEARGNGTRLTNNGTRLWHYLAADDWTAGSRASGRVRLFGSDEGYRQNFSSVNAPRTTETLTRLQHVRTQELGASTDASIVFRHIAFVAGADVRDIRATDNEVSLNTSPGTNTSARQRFIGGFGEALAAGHSGFFRNTSAAASIRLDSASNLDTRIITQPNPQPVLLANRNEIIPSPRFGVLRSFTLGQSGSTAVIHASVFRAFRTPTMNELYRTGQVGAQTTLANSQLQSERATGWEAGAAFASPSNLIALQGTYFWTEINRPVSTVLLSTNLYMRENLGQILSQGTELHLDLRPRAWLSATLGYQYSHATVTKFSAQPILVGNWIPEVPRHSVTAQLRAQSSRLGELTLAARASGHVYDDSLNTYAFILHSFIALDLSGRHDFGRRWSANVILQNLLNQRPDAARTPTLTLGSPFLAEGGVSFHWDRSMAH